MATYKQARPSEANEATKLGSAEVAELLRVRIQNGELRPGERLVEADLVTVLGSSRMRVREALRRLEAEGFVEVHEHRATFVKKFTLVDVVNFNRAREVLEGLAARLVAERPFTPEMRAELSEIRSGMDLAERANDRAGYLALNKQFHDFILQHCGNPYVVNAVEKLRTPIIRLWFKDVLGTLISEQNEDHHAIMDALLASDEAGAEEAMRVHIRNGGRALAAVNERHFQG